MRLFSVLCAMVVAMAFAGCKDEEICGGFEEDAMACAELCAVTEPGTSTTSVCGTCHCGWEHPHDNRCSHKHDHGHRGEGNGHKHHPTDQ